MKPISIKLSLCYKLAWKSFTKWWIPLCLISGGIFVLELLPRIFVHQDIQQIVEMGERTALGIIDKKPVSEDVFNELLLRLDHLRNKLLKHGVYTFPAVAFLTVVLLMTANRAVKNKKERKPPMKLIFISIIHIILSIIKLMAFFLFIIPGAYIYIRLLFVSLFMLEKVDSPIAAVRASWQITRGNFWNLFLLIFVNTFIQMVSLVTIIGIIPTTAFANTARAAAFQMLLQNEQIQSE